MYTEFGEIEGRLSEPSSGNDNFSLLYRSVYPLILRTVYLVVLDQEVARDITHEAFLRLWERRNQLAAESNEKAWLMRVATNLAISYRRWWLSRLRWRPKAPASDDPAALALAALERSEVRHALQTLSPRDRAIVVLRYEGGLTFAEIGDVLACPEMTAKTRLRRALEKLRRQLGEGSGDTGLEAGHHRE